jgi:hypothetical protein
MVIEHTKETIRALLQRNDTAVERAILALYKLQTRDEQQDHNSKYRNAQGFSGAHALIRELIMLCQVGSFGTTPVWQTSPECPRNNPTLCRAVASYCTREIFSSPPNGT